MSSKPDTTTGTGAIFMLSVWTSVHDELPKSNGMLAPLLLIQRKGAPRPVMFVLRVAAPSQMSAALTAACLRSEEGDLYALVTQAYIWTRPTPALVNMAELDEDARARLGIVEGAAVMVWQADGSKRTPGPDEVRRFQAPILDGGRLDLDAIAELDDRGAPRLITAGAPN